MFESVNKAHAVVLFTALGIRGNAESSSTFRLVVPVSGEMHLLQLPFVPFVHSIVTEVEIIYVQIVLHVHLSTVKNDKSDEGLHLEAFLYSLRFNKKHFTD